MRMKVISLAVASALGMSILVSGCNADDNDGTAAGIKSVEFIGMDAPSTIEQKADMYSDAKMVVTYTDGRIKIIDMVYNKLFDTTDSLGGSIIGGLFDHLDAALNDNDGQMASDAPDGTALMMIPGLKASGATSHSLAMVSQFEYKSLPPNDGVSTGEFWSRLPAATGLTLLDQGTSDGKLTPLSYSNISFKDVMGGWIHCGASLSGWNTFLGSEEYEPDAKTREGLARASDSDDGTDINSFSKYYFGNAAKANAYHYGLVPEVTVNSAGKASVVKHFATGRFAREMMEMGSDNRTAIGGDDGANTGLFMFVGDKEKDLSAGSIYAAKVSQTSPANGGSFDLTWINLGHATNAEIKAMVDGEIKFSDIFDVSVTDPGDASFTKIKSYTGTEWLRLKPGMEKAAAFLETRRYAAYLGATTEFSKMEYIAYNAKDSKYYVVISRVEKGMADTSGAIQVARNDGGVIYEMSVAGAQKDTSGATINSNLVGTKLVGIPELVGGWNGGVKDAEGNQCSQNKICGPDNIRYVDSIRTLFIGEDTSRRNNNYVWAFNVDTRKLSRVLSVPMGAEATGLMVAENYNGYSYIMSNFQHAGEGGLSNYTGTDKTQLTALIDSKWGNRKKAALGYIGVKGGGALPRMK